MEGLIRAPSIQNPLFGNGHFGQNFQSHFISSLGNNISQSTTNIASKQPVSPQPATSSVNCLVKEIRRNQNGVVNSGSSCEKSQNLEVIPDNGNLPLSEEIVCKHCDQKFSFQNGFYEHLRIFHNYEKPYVCLERGCDKVFLKRKSLDCHLRDYHRQKINIVKRQYVKVDGKWKCDLCDKTYDSIATLSGHRFRHFEPRFSCIHCQFKCYDTGGMRVHLKRHRGEKVISHRKFPCPTCKKEFKFKRSLIQHNCGKEPVQPPKEKRRKPKRQLQQKEVKEGCIMCELCGNSYVNKGGLRQHMKKFHSVNSCGICLTNFSIPRELLYHYKEIHDEEPPLELLKKIATYSHQFGEFLCEVCSKVFNTNTALTHHMKRHYKEKIASQCPVCKTQYLSKEEMKIHLEEAHKDEDLTKIVPLSLPRCDICDREYMNEDSLQRHKNRVHGEKTIVCQYCDKIYPRANRNEYKVHLNYHTGVKPFKCDQCNKTFLTKQNLTFHQQNRHLKYNPLYCRQCKKLFVTKERHQDHLNEMHIGKFKELCDICHWGCNDKMKLMRHVRNGHRDEMNKDFKPHKCLFCPKRYTSWNSLKTHYSKCEANVEKVIPGGKNTFPKFDEVVSVMEEFLCNICFFVFANQFDCINHFKSVHNLLKEDAFNAHIIIGINSKDSNVKFNELDSFISKDSNSEFKKAPFLCKVCRKYFISRRGFHKHIKCLHRTLKRSFDGNLNAYEGRKIRSPRKSMAKYSFDEDDSSEQEFSDSEGYDDATDSEEDASESDFNKKGQSEDTKFDGKIDAQDEFHFEYNSVISLHSDISTDDLSSSTEKDYTKRTTRQSARLKAKSIINKRNRVKSSKCSIRKGRKRFKTHVGEKNSITKDYNESCIETNANSTEKVTTNREKNVKTANEANSSLGAPCKESLAEASGQVISKVDHRVNVDLISQVSIEEEMRSEIVDDQNFMCKVCNLGWEKLVYFEKHVNEFHPDYYDIYPREEPDYSYLKIVARETIRIMKEKEKQDTIAAEESIVKEPKPTPVRKSKLKLILPETNPGGNDSRETVLNKETHDGADESDVDDVPLTSNENARHLNTGIQREKVLTSPTIINSNNAPSSIPLVTTKSDNVLPEMALRSNNPANTGEFLQNFLYSSGNERPTSFNNLSTPSIGTNYTYNNQLYQNYQLPRDQYTAMNQNPIFPKPSLHVRQEHQMNQNTGKEFSLPDWDNIFTPPVKNKSIPLNTNQRGYPNAENPLPGRNATWCGNSRVTLQNSCLNHEFSSTIHHQPQLKQASVTNTSFHSQPNYPGPLIPLSQVANYQGPLATNTTSTFAATLPRNNENRRETLQVSDLVKESDEDQSNVHDNGFDINYDSESNCDEPRENNASRKSQKGMEIRTVGSTRENQCEENNGQYESHFIKFTKRNKLLETKKEECGEAIDDPGPKISDTIDESNEIEYPPQLNTKQLEEARSKAYACLKCPMYYARRQSLITHYKRSHLDIPECEDLIKELENEKKKPETCHICQKQFPGLNRLKDHIRFVHSVKKVDCSICGKTFTKMSYLKTHLAMHEKVGLLKPDDDALISYNNFKFECHSCDQVFTRKDSLQRHLDSHDKMELLFLCPKCEGKFTSVNTFKKHLFYHKEYYPFVCCNCERELESLKALEIHIVNECNKIFKCLKCDLTFDNVSAMRYHSYDRHIDDRLECPACSRKFPQTHSLNKHLNRRRLKGNVCDKETSVKKRKDEDSESLDEGKEDSRDEVSNHSASFKLHVKNKKVNHRNFREESRNDEKLKRNSKPIVKKRRKASSVKVCSGSDSNENSDIEMEKSKSHQRKNDIPNICNVRPSRACKPRNLKEVNFDV